MQNETSPTPRPLYNKDYTELSSGNTDYGFCDKQGRAVGYSWRIFKVVYSENTEGRSGYFLPEGMPLEHIEVAAYPTRNGRHYGASTRNPHCLTIDEALGIIQKRIEQARKRDAKKFGGVR